MREERGKEKETVLENRQAFRRKFRVDVKSLLFHLRLFGLLLLSLLLRLLLLLLGLLGLLLLLLL